MDDLRRHWVAYAPTREGTILRALDPASAPLATAIERHLRTWPIGLT